MEGQSLRDPLVMSQIDRYINGEHAIPYEYELLANSNQDRALTWKRYIQDAKSQLHQQEDEDGYSKIIWLYERCIHDVSNNLEAYKDYLEWLHSHNSKIRYAAWSVRVFAMISPKILQVSLAVWFLSTILETQNLGLIRFTFDTCLRNLNPKYHHKLWAQLLNFLQDRLRRSSDSSEVDYWSSFLLSRYLSVCTDNTRLKETLHLFSLTNDFVTMKELYEQNLELVCNTNSLSIGYLNCLQKLHQVEQYKTFWNKMIKRKMDSEFMLELVNLKLKYWLKLDKFEEMEQVFENITGSSFQDYLRLYDMHLDFEKRIIAKLIDMQREKQVITHLTILQDLIDHHRLNINEFHIRQNPNVVDFWQERASLFASDDWTNRCSVYSKAVLAIDPAKLQNQAGKFGKLWCSYAQIYWDNKNYDNARELYSTALKVPFLYKEDLEHIWISWAENELPHDIHRAINILEEALLTPEYPEALIQSYYSKTGQRSPAQSIIFTSIKLWSLYFDILETLDNEKDMVTKILQKYEEAIALKIATPLFFINYGGFLQKHGFVAESFQIYERALNYFPQDIKYEIWDVYLGQVMRHRNLLAIENIRGLFDQAIVDLKNLDCKKIYIQYSDFEESVTQYYKKSVDILMNGANSTPNKKDFLKSKLTLYDLAIAKCKRYLSKSYARDIYEQCIQLLPNSSTIKYVLEFASLETELSEIYRAREILKYGAQLLPPSQNKELWDAWDEFELSNGNKDAYKEMLKLKKTLEAEMRVDTLQSSRQSGNIEFVVSSEPTKTVSSEPARNPEEIELDL